jgi:hypothetical protein
MIGETHSLVIVDPGVISLAVEDLDNATISALDHVQAREELISQEFQCVAKGCVKRMN